MATSPIAVIGAGSWGCALAMLMARNGSPVRLWDIDAQTIQAMQTTGFNNRYLPNVPLPEKLKCFEQIEAALTGVDDVMLVVPSHAFADVLTKLNPLFTGDVRLAWATKGLQPQTGRFLEDVALDIIGTQYPLAALAGPTFALEVAKGLPSAIAVVSHHEQFARDLSQRLSNPHFKVTLGDDLKGVQLCGAVKNVLAIATGLCDGIGFGANARCALLTRGLAEMTRLGLALGAKQETFMGLAGLGDLVLTCTDNQSRNRRLGLALGEGQSIQEAIEKIGQVVEGVGNAQEVLRLAQQYQIDMPIIEQTNQLLQGKITAAQAAEY